MSEYWYITAKKKLIDSGMSRRELADKTGVNYTVLCAVLSGKLVRETVKEKVCSFLKIEKRR